MRIATYNVEWFDVLFDDDGRLIADDSWSVRHDVTKAMQIEALGIVFTAMDADAVLVIEAPDTNRRRDTVRALETFASVFDLRACKAVMGFANDTRQEIALMYDPGMLSAAHDPKGPAPVPGVPPGEGAPRFDGTFRIDLDVDATEDKVVFSKPPFEVAMTVRATGADDPPDRHASEIQGATWRGKSQRRDAPLDREPAQTIGAGDLGARTGRRASGEGGAGHPAGGSE